jgi:hypothetical protein
MKNSEIKIAETYIKECLLKPPALEGILPAEQYLKELNYELKSGFRDIDNYSEAVGTIVGGSIFNLVLARCIYTYVSERNPIKPSIRYQSALNKLYNELESLINLTQKPLNVGKATIGAGQYRNYLISARDPKVTLQSEIEASSELKQLRSSALTSFSPRQLVEELCEQIRSTTGYSPEDFD